MKRIVSILFLAVLLFSMMSLPSFAEGSGILSLSNGEGKPGDTVNIDVSLDSNPGFISLKFIIEWEEGLELISVHDAEVIHGFTKPSPKVASPYTIRWADPFAENNNATTGKIATLTFKIKEDAELGAKPIRLNFSESWALGKNKVSFEEKAEAVIYVNCAAHRFSNEYTNFSETEHSKACTLCGYLQSEAHSFGKFLQKKAPTCTESGEERAKCSVCKKEISRSVPASGHNMQSPLVTKEPTCTEEGMREGYCSVCKLNTKEILKPKGHSFGEAVITKEATETETGIKTYTCKVCGSTAVEQIPILGSAIPEKDFQLAPDSSESNSEKAAAATTDVNEKENKKTSLFALVFLVFLAILIGFAFYRYFFHQKR